MSSGRSFGRRREIRFLTGNRIILRWFVNSSGVLPARVRFWSWMFLRLQKVWEAGVCRILISKGFDSVSTQRLASLSGILLCVGWIGAVQNPPNSAEIFARPLVAKEFSIRVLMPRIWCRRSFRDRLVSRICQRICLGRNGLLFCSAKSVSARDCAFSADAICSSEVCHWPRHLRRTDLHPVVHSRRHGLVRSRHRRWIRHSPA